MKKKVYTTEVGGKTLTAEFNDLAEQAQGSVLMKYGNTVILATAVMGSKPKEGGDFLPLTVDYEEKFYASGQILGSRFVRREGKPSEEAILAGRLIDRTIRPLFDQWIRNEIQVIITVLSLDEDAPDILAVIGASLALGISEIPWNGPVSAIRIGKLKEINEFIINPSYTWRENPLTEFELIAGGLDSKINMIELGGKETQEETVITALTYASTELEKIQQFQKKIISEIGKKKKLLAQPEVPVEIRSLFNEAIAPKLESKLFSTSEISPINTLKEEWSSLAKAQLPTVHRNIVEGYFEDTVDRMVHDNALDKNRRVDGRKFDEIRPLYAQAGGISPILHGSGIFYRGSTHILSVLALGGPGDSQIIEEMGDHEQKRFIHHYNFPPFSTGETGRVGNTNRRMIGHGTLAEKALEAVLPSKELFPYTIRIVSEALSSNGSTSMASICASTLALMDAGVPITKAVAGIASGLMMRGEEYKILTDIQGPEDHYGDMDLKVAGTKDGITAIQMDVKVKGIPLGVFPEALTKAKTARLEILNVLLREIKEPRKEISPKAPKIVTLKIQTEQIGLVIGPGGKKINSIKQKSAADSIEIEEDGTVFITGKNGSAERALEMITELTREYKKRL